MQARNLITLDDLDDLLVRCLLVFARRGEVILRERATRLQREQVEREKEAKSAGTLGSDATDLAKSNGNSLLPKDRPTLSVRKDLQRELDKVALYLRNVPNVNFEVLDPRAFEDLVVALLAKLRFTEIQISNRNLDYGYDPQAKTRYRDPFGNNHDLNWLIELKRCKQSRADIEALSKLSYHLVDLPANHSGILIANSQLTSAAREWLQENEHSRRTQITVVDGVQPREIILKCEDLVEQFWGVRG